MFTLNQLQCYVAVAEELHFGRAARRLSMTQPPLSRQIKLLESTLGVRLLERSSRAVSLTPAGRTLLAEARRILRLSDETVLSVTRVPSGESGTLVVGFTAASVRGPVTRLVARLSERYPGVELVLRELLTADQLASIGSGDVDLGLLRPPVRGAGFHWRPVHEEAMVLALPAAHPLAASVSDPLSGEADADGPERPALGLDVLDGLPLVMYSPVEARYFHELLTRAAEARGIVLQPTQYVSQVHTMLALVQAGLGAAVVPASSAETTPRGVVLRPIADAPRAELVAAWRAGADNPVLGRALELLGDGARL